MSMDEQFQYMVNFHRSLSEFNDHLTASIHELEERHDFVSPLWQDEMRRSYDEEWTRFKERMDLYVKRDSRQFSDFLRSKINLLDRYLRGG